MTIESKLAEWSGKSGLGIMSAERQFIEDLRKAAAAGVGYGWMQQVIEWEWQATGIMALGPEFYTTRIAELEKRHTMNVGESKS